MHNRYRALKLNKTTISPTEGSNCDSYNTPTPPPKKKKNKTKKKTKKKKKIDRPPKIVSLESEPKKYLQMANSPKNSHFSPKPQKMVKVKMLHPKK